jgi:hypothetical protein
MLAYKLNGAFRSQTVYSPKTTRGTLNLVPPSPPLSPHPDFYWLDYGNNGVRLHVVSSLKALFSQNLFCSPSVDRIVLGFEDYDVCFRLV